MTVRSGAKQWFGIVGGLLTFLFITSCLNLEPGRPVVTRTAAVAALMAIWWVTEAVPLPVTALLPIALFPLLGIMNGNSTAALYFNDIIFLFIGGFIIALAMQRWHLHRRIALRTILLIGHSPRLLLLGFMAATAFLSMWVSNTATAMMMTPMGMAIILKLKEDFGDKTVSRFATALMLGIAYAASIGGVATLIGTPPNLVFVRILAITFPNAPEITFATWLAFGLPFAAVFLIVAWAVLVLMFMRDKKPFATDRTVFKNEYACLGRISFEERVVLSLLLLLAALWIFRQDINLGSVTIPGWSRLAIVPDFLSDGTVAICVALLLFVIPSRQERGKWVMDWPTASKLNWGIVLLFGGGFALAGGIQESGLSGWLGRQMTGLHDLPPVVLVGSVCAMLTFLTELTSNTAITQVSLPVLASLAVSIQVNPLFLMLPATLAASCGFMLPVGTPPNAIVFGTGEVRMADMVKTGLILDVISVVLLTACMFLFGMSVFDINLSQFPGWAVTP